MHITVSISCWCSFHPLLQLNYSCSLHMSPCFSSYLPPHDVIQIFPAPPEGYIAHRSNKASQINPNTPWEPEKSCHTIKRLPFITWKISAAESPSKAVPKMKSSIKSPVTHLGVCGRRGCEMWALCAHLGAGRGGGLPGTAGWKETRFPAVRLWLISFTSNMWIKNPDVMVPK